jgi:cysteine-rich repeat protein
VCGDGEVRGYESCDDGNTTSDDGCDANCNVEAGFTCPYGEPCRLVVCGDGFTDGYLASDGTWHYEQCDDGNSTSGDGCSAACEPEPGFMCYTPGEPCKDVACGDGAVDAYYVLIEGNAGSAGTGGTFGAGGAFGQAGAGPTGPYIGYAYEGCDDGNTVNGDGCTAACEPESGWICEQPGQPCRRPRCGDGFVDFVPGAGGAGGAGGTSGASGFGGMAGSGNFGSWEECDDGNSTSGDGCDASCVLEPGYSCSTSGTPCKLAVCGDGVADYPVEDCDDGNTANGDFCDGHCRYEFGAGGVGGFSGVGGGVTAGSGTAGSAGSSGGLGGQSARRR